MKDTSIQWTMDTWNPYRGCTNISEGCRFCYARDMSARFSGEGQPYEGLAYMKDGESRWTGVLKRIEHMMNKPLSWKKPRLIFVNSMSDMFHENIPDDGIQEVFDVMRRAHWHQFQVLTKRSERLVDMNDDIDWPDNVWMGVSVEDTKARQRILHLHSTDAKVKFLSIEPLIEHLYHLQLNGMDWVIVGGESGSNARPMDLNWVESIVDDCMRQQVPVFVKQMGSVWAKQQKSKHKKGGDIEEWPDSLKIRQFPKFYTDLQSPQESQIPLL